MYIGHGKYKRLFIGAALNGARAVEVRLGDEVIWPDPDNVAQRIVVTLPDYGTTDWKYWVHALDAVGRKANFSNYLRFTVNGQHFYLVNAPDGSVPFIVNNNQFTLSFGERPLLDKLGDILEVEANIQARSSDYFYFEKGASEATLNLPYIDDTDFHLYTSKYKKKVYTKTVCDIFSMGSGEVLTSCSLMTDHHKRVGFNLTRDMAETKIWDSTRRWLGMAKMIDGDHAMRLSINNSGSCLTAKARYKFPAFKRTFKLKIQYID